MMPMCDCDGGGETLPHSSLKINLKNKLLFGEQEDYFHI